MNALNTTLLSTFRQDTIESIMAEREILDFAKAELFLARAEKRGSGFATGNVSFPIQYTTRQTRSYVAKRLNDARTIHIKMRSERCISVSGWNRSYFKGLVVGMSDMVDAVVNNDVEV